MQTKVLDMESTKGNPADYFQHPAPLGSNLYDRNRVKALPPEGRQSAQGRQLSPVQSPDTAADPETAAQAGIA